MYNIKGWTQAVGVEMSFYKLPCISEYIYNDNEYIYGCILINLCIQCTGK